MHVLFWGTYDLGKPRVRILLRGLEEAGVEVTECHSDVWSGIEDKSQLNSLVIKLRLAARWLCSYPSLIWRFLRQPKPDVVVVGYLGHLDVLILWSFAKLRGVPIILDAFVSLYSTVVEDRRMIGSRNLLSFLIYAWEWLACRAADLVLLDTKTHAQYFSDRFHLKNEHVAAVFVGAEPKVFGCRNLKQDDPHGFTVLFYGQFIPLHGIPTIIEAARLLQEEDIRWIIIGKGQEEIKIRHMLSEQPLPNLEWIPWVRYAEIDDWIAKADVCLGIFDDGIKASMVIPNKVFQILAAGKPLITRDSPAIRELLTDDNVGIWLVEAKDPRHLAEAIVASRSFSDVQSDLHSGVRKSLSSRAIGIRLRDILSDLHHAHVHS